MATATKKETAPKAKTNAAPAKPKSEKKPKAETKIVEAKDVTNVQVRVTKEKKAPQGLKIYKVSTPLKNDELVLSKLTSIQKAKNWIKRIFGVKN
jgi:hypothetical protein